MPLSTQRLLNQLPVRCNVAGVSPRGVAAILTSQQKKGETKMQFAKRLFMGLVVVALIAT
jgi:hypothetical protein